MRSPIFIAICTLFDKVVASPPCPESDNRFATASKAAIRKTGSLPVSWIVISSLGSVNHGAGEHGPLNLEQRDGTPSRSVVTISLRRTNTF